jgi:STE24 endopeptidase
MNEDKATRYHRLRRRAVMLASAWRIALLLSVLLSGLGLALGGASAAAAQAVAPSLSRPVSVLIFVTLLALAHDLGALPIMFYGGFVLDRRYGLVRHSAASWLRDQVKAASVNFAYLAVAAIWIYAWLAYAPERWWIAAWVGALAAAVATAWAAPIVLLPLFFKFVPLRNDALRQRLLALAARAGVPALGVFEWRTSDRTSRANAALTGIGRTRRIILSDTLVTDYPEVEVEAVIAHELAHHVRHDIWRTLGVDGVVTLAAFLAADAALRAAAAPAGLQGLSDPAGMPVLALAMMAVGWAASPLQNAMSRAHERQADGLALALTRNVEAFINAMRRLGACNLAEEAPTLMTRLFFHTHPPIGDRIAFARVWSEQQGPQVVPPGAPEGDGVRDAGA